MNRYEVFVKVVEHGSFTKAAEELLYTQSAISQMIKTLEDELSATLVIRSRKGIVLTKDGEEYYPYIKAVCNAHRELEGKYNEMQGLQNSIIRLGTFTSVSRNILPQIMKEFKEKFPMVRYELQQGEYTNIGKWINEGVVDLGFVNPDAVKNLVSIPIMHDEMMAVIPFGHPLADKKVVSLNELARESYILLDEGEVSIPLNAFKKVNLSPDIVYKVYDDYTIMSMVEQGLGISIMYNTVLKSGNYKFAVIPIKEKTERTIAVAYKDKRLLSIASKQFLDFLLKKLV